MSAADLRPCYRRQAARELVQAILDKGEASADAVRVETFPPSIDRRIVGQSVLDLQEDGLIYATGEFRASRRPWANANPKRLWRATDRNAVREWLRRHPPLSAPPANPGLFDSIE